MGSSRIARVEDVERDFLQMHRGFTTRQLRSAKRLGLNGCGKCRQSDVVFESYSRKGRHSSDLATSKGCGLSLGRFCLYQHQEDSCRRCWEPVVVSTRLSLPNPSLKLRLVFGNVACSKHVTWLAEGAEGSAVVFARVAFRTACLLPPSPCTTCQGGSQWPFCPQGYSPWPNWADVESRITVRATLAFLAQCHRKHSVHCSWHTVVFHLHYYSCKGSGGVKREEFHRNQAVRAGDRIKFASL